MKHQYRFLGSLCQEGQWLLSKAESQHASRVLRLQSGDTVEVTDGKGHWAIGEIDLSSKTQGKIVTNETYFEDPKDAKLALAVGALKGGDFDDLLPGIVELGLDQIFVFGGPGVDKNRLSDKAQQRWQRIIDASVKQSKRNWRPELVSLAKVTDLFPQIGHYRNRLVFDAKGEKDRSLAIEQSTLVVVGGEKGLTEGELKALQEQSFRPMSVAKNVLRARTAVLAAASLMAYLSP